MRRLYRFLGCAVAIAGVVSVIVVAFALRTDILSNGQTIYTHKLAIRQVTFDSVHPNTLLADVIYTADPDDSGVVFTNAIIKNNSTGQTVAEGDVVPNVLPANTLMTVTISLSSNLPSGTYTATFATSKGGSFVSPSFSKP